MIGCVLMLCEGNICRSPMAQGLLAARLPGVDVISAGCRALVGRKADPLAIELMAQRGIDIGGHVASNVNLEHIKKAELVLAMTHVQQKEIERRYPFCKGRVYRIAGHDGEDVVDPYRHGRPVFETSLAQIERGLTRWTDAITRLNK